MKIAGEMTSIDQEIEPLSWKDTFEFAQSLVDEKQHDVLTREKNLDFGF